MMNRALLAPLPLLLGVSLALSGCAGAKNQTRLDYSMGERVPLGPLTYNVLETDWRSQLGDGFKIRVPEQRFLLITVSATNGSGKEVSVPLLRLENQNNGSFLESDNGESVDNWFGLLRTLAPTETRQGRLLFDVALSSYRLRLTDGGEPGTEKYAWVDIPLRLDTGTEIQTPPGDLPK
jgi:hypothetical protein